MNARALLIGPGGRPRAPWRILLFLLLSGVCTTVVVIALKPVLESVERFTGLAGTKEAYGVTIALLLAHFLTLRTFDKQPWSFVWLHRVAARPQALAAGGILGAAPIGLASLLLVGVGFLSIIPAPDGPWLEVAFKTLVFLLPAAFLEELLSRGYLFATLREWLGARAAVIATSVGFGLLHIPNPNVSAMSIVLVTLAGIYLAVVLLATQSLYAAWVAHFAWNWVMAALLHVPVSGLPLTQPDYRMVDAGPDWITGGPWGPEGGAAAGLGMIGGMAYLYWRARRSGVPAESREPKVSERATALSRAAQRMAGNNSKTNESN